MKKSDIIYNTGIVVLIVAIAFVVVYKFVLGHGPRDSFAIEKIDQIRVTDLTGSEMELSDFFSKSGDTYCLIFALNDCFSCIYKGINHLETLKKSGHACVGVVVHDYPEEVEGWAANYDFSPFLILKRVSFYEHLKAAKTPVLVKLKNNEVQSYNYISLD